MQTKYLQSFGRTKSRKLRNNANRLMAEILPLVRVDEFPKSAYKETWLEIGFGDGGHLLHQAISNPQIGFIGCEPFINGTVKLLRGIEENKLNNIRIFPGDFRELILSSSGYDPRIQGVSDSIVSQTLDPRVKPEDDKWVGIIDRVFILFPDPWPKKKQKKRRLVSKESLDLLARIMKQGAKLRIATDHEDYAKWIVRELLAHDKFRWLAQSKHDWQTQPTDHIETKYQKKNLANTSRAIFFEAICDKKAGKS